jgi:UDP:flavonoid glycosyltransferase YjiC (YdhE family)
MDMGIGAALKFTEATHEVRAAVQRMLEQLTSAEAAIELKRKRNAAAAGIL